MADLVARAPDGGYELRLGDNERDVLGAVLAELRELLLSPDDPSLTRLFPPAYGDDSERNAEYAALVRDELLERRLAAIDVVEATLTAEHLDDEQLHRWMGAVNDLRLVLGTRLDVTEDMTRPRRRSANAPAYALYDYLSWLLSELVDAASS
jgi:hypothetical protein